VTTEHFNLEMKRLYGVFGEKSYPHEKIKMIWGHWKDLPDHAFTKLVSNLISTQRTSPLPKDFIEAAHQERKRVFTKDAEGAANTFDWGAQKGPKEYLSENYPGCDSIAEAVKIQIELNQAKKEREGGS
jgi:hypothetical protein